MNGYIDALIKRIELMMSLSDTRAAAVANHLLATTARICDITETFLVEIIRRRMGLVEVRQEGDRTIFFKAATASKAVEDLVVETCCEVQVLPKGRSADDPEVWKRGSKGLWMTVMTVKTAAYVTPFVKTRREEGGFDWAGYWADAAYQQRSYNPWVDSAMSHFMREFLGRNRP